MNKGCDLCMAGTIYQSASSSRLGRESAVFFTTPRTALREKKGLIMINKNQTKLKLPNGADRLLLHSCCAPCAGAIMEKLAASGIHFTIFFYNPNIHPEKEYLIRKNENIRFAEKLGVPFVDADYDRDNWLARAKGMEYEPERGARCTMCFDMRFERTALYAYENGFTIISSTLGISRWKNMDQINECGVRAAHKYPNMFYWTLNWRKQGGSQRMIELSKEENFYQQEYCGCVYSLRDTNRWRLKNGRSRIEIGLKFYGKNEPSKISQ
ncbi:epoxyqueuosine reductase QueH [Coxiella burnetii]|uniref:epoxyqueuosine reductase QueH n=1 Tax=Coxiella burnetii TaxID=777 RepID=UPI001EDFB08A|nr:epoxyqueuosine reductase QueH [Coxiella burnetii]UYK69665.1 epoxyqueuosine reductase QueH [Coxiella burnetii]